jgi:hypothetical protein
VNSASSVRVTRFKALFIMKGKSEFGGLIGVIQGEWAGDWKIRRIKRDEMEINLVAIDRQREKERGRR